MVHLKVVHALPDDIGKRVVRATADVMKSFNFFEDEIIEIISDRKRTPAIIKALKNDHSDISIDTGYDKSWDKDWDEERVEGYITMDGLLRASIECSLNSVVRIDKTAIKKARKVVLQPLHKIPSVLPEEDKYQLIGVPLTTLDIIEMNFRHLASVDEISDDFDNNFDFRFMVTEVEPNGLVQVGPETEIVIKEHSPQVMIKGIGTLTYEDFGGYWRQKKRIHELIELPLRNPDFFKPININFPKGVLISGPSGVGKSLLARTVASESNVTTILVDVSNILTTDLAEAERQIRRYFREAKIKAPSIILIDDIDLIANNRDKMTTSEITRRITTLLLQEIDSIKESESILMIGTSSRVEEIDPAFRRPGRLDVEINMSAPDSNDREEILLILSRNIPTELDLNLHEIALRTKGFLGADLTMVVKQASIQAFRRILPSIDLREKLPTNLLSTLRLSQRDFEEALKYVNASAMKEIISDIPDTKWGDIGGLDDQRKELQEAVEWPLQYPEAFDEMGITPPSGVLLFGPPGTGKTLLAKAVANETQSNFIPIRGPELASKWFGDTEKAIRDIFRRAREMAPTVIFFDEVDSLMRVRSSSGDGNLDRIINQFLTELDGIDKKGRVLIIGATNRPELLDPAIIRPGRFDRLVYIPIPNLEARKKILEVHTQNMPLAEDVNLDAIATKTNFYVGADLENLCREAAMLSLRENIENRIVKLEHFEQALKKTGPSMNAELVKNFDNLARNLRGKVNSLRRRNFDSYM